MNSSPPSKLDKLKRALQVIAGFLTVLKWLPLGSWRNALLALSAMIGVLITAIEKCESNPQGGQPPVLQPSITPTPTPTPTPTHTPTASPTPSPEIIIDRIPEAGWPFTVRYTAKFEYNIYLWADQYKLQVLGQDFKTGYMVAPAVVLRNPGPRRLTVRNIQGNILAEKTIEVRR